MNIDWDHVKDACTEHGRELRASLLNSTAMQRVSGFGRDEDGASGVLSFYTTLMLLVMAGLGVDTMRQEMERTHLQSTLDAAVLAGAGAPQGTDVQGVADIVEDYFEKNDMSEYLSEMDLEGDDADIETSLNATRVYAEASMDIDTYLLQMTGVDELQANAAAEAQVATPKLEVSLVLDVSGSMRGNKLTNMQTAARSFVTTILGQSSPGDSVISVVPFAWNVTPSPELFDALTVTNEHTYSTCIRFDDNDYLDAYIDPDRTYQLQEFTSRYDDGFDALDPWWRTCYNDENAEILPYSTNEAALHAHINGLTADGNTSAHIGLKWGSALLDDEFQDVVDELQTAEVVDASLDHLPAVHGEAETLKIIVLMADGQNTTSYYLNDNGSYLGSDSDLHKVTWQDMEFDYAWRIRKKGGIKTSDDPSKCSKKKWTCEYTAVGDAYSAYYLYDAGDDRYLDIEASWGLADRNSDGYEWVSSDDFDDFSELDGTGGGQTFVSSEAVSWEIAWGLISPDFIDDIIGDYGPEDDFVNQQTHYGSKKDGLMQNICTAAKSEGVVVYTIGYAISAGGNAETQLETCASSLNHYYPTDGAGISAAFNSIASNVKNLRLTQ
ncbi:MAG: pilus assembly protein TadG-related protein [Pseudomonadota bacterium]